MAIKKISDIFYTTSRQPLDSKLTPLKTISELNYTTIPRRERYKGMEIVVLNEGTTGIATCFILHDGTSDDAWRIKDKLIVNNNSDIEPFKKYLLDGTNITVLSDETNKGQLTEYISGIETIVTDEGLEETVVVFKKINNDGVITYNDLALKRLNNHEIGALIYLQDTIYSYTKEENEELITVYTDNLGDIPEDILAATGYTENPTGFYVLQKIDGKEVLSQMILKNEINSINIPIEGDDTGDLPQTGDEANETP